MKVAIAVKKIQDFLTGADAPKHLVSLAQDLYKSAYAEGYADGKSDCEESQAEEDDVKELY